MAAPKRRRVLFVEDETALRASYERFFDRQYEMAFAGNGSDAIRRLDDFSPDVLVLDMRLPDTDGIDLLQRIRRSRPALPVVVTSVYESMEPLMTVLDLAHTAYLVKPFDLTELARCIDAASG